jgi:hypothetical protein
MVIMTFADRVLLLCSKSYKYFPAMLEKRLPSGRKRGCTGAHHTLPLDSVHCRSLGELRGIRKTPPF